MHIICHCHSFVLSNILNLCCTFNTFSRMNDLFCSSLKYISLDHSCGKISTKACCTLYRKSLIIYLYNDVTVRHLNAQKDTYQ